MTVMGDCFQRRHTRKGKANEALLPVPRHVFGDCMPFGKGDEFFLFHQRDNRNPEPFGEPFGWDLATTKDFVDYRDCGVAVPRGGDDEQDQFTS